MKTKLFILTTATALSCGTFSLLSQDAPPPPPPGAEGGRPPGGEGRPPGPPVGGGDRLAEFIKRADSDGDGKISREEFVNSTKKESEERFAKVDANSDGFADKTEIEEAGRKMREMAQRRPDGEGPGGMRRPEGGDGARPRPDGDGKPGNPPNAGDGGFRRPEGGQRPDGFRRPEGGQGDSQGRPGGQGGPGGGMMGGMLQRMDKDGDGAVTKDEFIAGNQENFDRMDENKDGKVTKDEMEAVARKMREMMGGGGRPGGDGGQGGFRRPEGDGARPRPEGGDRPKRPEGEAPAPPKDA